MLFSLLWLYGAFFSVPHLHFLPYPSYSNLLSIPPLCFLSAITIAFYFPTLFFSFRPADFALTQYQL